MSHDMLLRNKGWRIIVNLSKRSPTFFLAFGATCTAGAYYLAQATQFGTNPNDKNALFIQEDKLKRNAGLHAQVLAKANKERLRCVRWEFAPNRTSHIQALLTQLLLPLSPGCCWRKPGTTRATRPDTKQLSSKTACRDSSVLRSLLTADKRAAFRLSSSSSRVSPPTFSAENPWARTRPERRWKPRL